MAKKANSFKVGQRWVSQSEPDLGLGLVVEVMGRRVSVRFEAAEDDRAYAIDNAPLSRATFEVGESVRLRSGQSVVIEQAMEQADLMLYAGRDAQGEDCVFPETELCDQIRLHAPFQRLKSGVVDRLSGFMLRIETLQEKARVQQSEAFGLLGARTQLLAHQIYIAWEVSRRLSPRVLLADEVGLGKTIEAGLILHRQLLMGLASRILIVVPESLVNQWLVEMLRRFSLTFSVFNPDRFDALKEEDPESNPFETAQQVICSLDMLMQRPDCAEAAIAAGWDILVVDEAHHLHWSPEGSDPAYSLVEDLAGASRGLLLLTATPEQAGLESHFARLRLLDPARYHDLDAFREEEKQFETLVPVLSRLQALEDETLPESLRETLGQWFTEEELGQMSVEQCLNTLLDQYGTGRVLFRNTRRNVEGFPDRALESYPLAPLPSQLTVPDPDLLFALPEEAGEDPRVIWLEQHLKSLRPEKVLVICHLRETAEKLSRHLSLRCGIRCADFHEGMSLLERDRAAAYFADPDEDAQALICSEIGSEGRNFQFAHNLVLFDLPSNPDLLEQRIGRLDRIGQRHTVKIHVPVLQDTAQERLYRWLNEGLGVFTESFSAGYAVFEHFQDHLYECLSNPQTDLAGLIRETQECVASIKDANQKGRAPILELNSCRHDVADRLIDAIVETENGGDLKAYMEDICELFGAHHEEHSHHALILKPTDQMLTGHFPGLSNREALTVTFNREQALRREDMTFLSWEHPIVEECMDMLLSSEQGNATVVTLPLPGVAAGTLLLEAFFTFGVSLAQRNPLARLLPLQPIRVLTNAQGKDLSQLLPLTQLNELCQPVKRRMVPRLIQELGGSLSDLNQHASLLAKNALQPLLEQSTAEVRAFVDEEVSRLRRLQKVNPSVRDDEIDGLERLANQTLGQLEAADVTPAAYRLVVVTSPEG